MHSSRMRTASSSGRLLGGGSASVHAGISPWVSVWSPLTRCGPGIPPTQARPLSSPQCGPGDSPMCGPGDPPRCGPGDHHPPGVGLETPPRPGPSTSPWVWAWRPAWHAGIPPPPGDLQGILGYHLQCMLGYHPPPPWTDRHV